MTAMLSTIQNYMYEADFYTKPRRNFIQENMKQIKKLQLESKQKAVPNKGNIPKKSGRKKVSKRGGGGDADGDYIIRDLYISSSNKFDIPVTPETEIQNPRIKTQGCQTLPDAKEAYNEGVILYSRGKPSTPPPEEGKRNICIQVNNNQGDSAPDLHGIAGDSQPKNLPVKEDGKIDYVKLNALVPIRRKVCPSKPDPTKAPPTYQKGVLPKYLREAKKQHIEEIHEKGYIEIINDSECPEGSILLSEDEKKKHIKEMRKAYAGLVAELNTLPMRTDSLKSKKRREEIEKALENLEDGIKMFSRDKLLENGSLPKRRHIINENKNYVVDEALILFVTNNPNYIKIQELYDQIKSWTNK